MTLDFDDLPPLVERCWDCWEKPCPSCGGLGERPTKFGKAVLNLVAKHLKPAPTSAAPGPGQEGD